MWIILCKYKSAKSDSCVLLQQYPFDIPTEAFSFEIFKQAFVAVQSCVVHLQVCFGDSIFVFRSYLGWACMFAVSIEGVSHGCTYFSFQIWFGGLSQGVSLARRFALVPLGPPLLSYKSNCKAMLKAVGDFVQLEVDRPYHAGEPIVVWYVLHFYCMKVCTATFGSGCKLK